jgi:hypothetical protein
MVKASHLKFIGHGIVPHEFLTPSQKPFAPSGYINVVTDFPNAFSSIFIGAPFVIHVWKLARGAGLASYSLLSNKPTNE